jgi:hypothetical protein
MTGVSAPNQKLQGLKGSNKSDDVLLRDVLPASKKIALIGQPDEVKRILLKLKDELVNKITRKCENCSD